MTRRRNGPGGLADHFGPLELAVLEALWRPGTPVDVAECCRRIGGRQAYTTVKTVMERLVVKGHLARRREGKAYVYWPTASRAQLEEELAAEAARRLVSGFGELGVVGFAESVRGDAAQLARLRSLLDKIAEEEGLS